MEGFFATLKVERVYRRSYRTRDEATVDLFPYLEGFYNPRRRHSTLGGLSPAEFERQWAARGYCGFGGFLRSNGLENRASSDFPGRGQGPGTPGIHRFGKCS